MVKPTNVNKHANKLEKGLTTSRHIMAHQSRQFKSTYLIYITTQEVTVLKWFISNFRIGCNEF